jgi:sarcosine oxidase
MIGYSKHYDAIVVGVGGMGSSTCYQLARRGKRVLGIERFDIPHDLGSSHGYTRIIRLAYYEDPSYVMLLRRAFELWAEIEDRAHQKLFYQTGSVDAGPAESWVFKGSLQSCVDHGLTHEVLTGAEMSTRWPGYQLPFDIMGVFQPDGGFLVPERATVAFVEAAHSLGAEIHGREQVLDWEPRGDGVRVITDRAEYEADSLVFAAGSWSHRMLPFLEGLSVPERQVLAWLQPERPEYFTPETFPVFNLLVDEGRFYGFPVYGVPGFKFGKYHHFEEVVNPDTYDREPDIEDEEMLREFAARYFPDGAGPTMSLKACMFINSPDNHFIIDLHPDYPQVSFATGFSGHGYKFASVIGEVMADLAERHSTRHEISLFRLERFTGRLSALYEDRPIRRAAPGSGEGHLTRIATPRPATHAQRRRVPLPRRGLYHLHQRGRSIRRLDGIQRTRRTSRQIPGRYPAHRGDAGTYWDTTDPRYWDEGDVEPFWL